MKQAKRLLELEDFLALGEEERGPRAQFLDGQIVPKAKPGGEHGEAEASITLALGPFVRRSRRDGTGGWWLKVETSVLYPTVRQVPTHDLVGWRRSRVPESPKGYPVKERPDWVCEVAVSSLKWDTRDMPRLLEAEGVPFYWVIDPINANLRVYETREGKLVETMNLFREDGEQRIPPFEALPLSVGMLLGDEPEGENADEGEPG